MNEDLLWEVLGRRVTQKEFEKQGDVLILRRVVIKIEERIYRFWLRFNLRKLRFIRVSSYGCYPPCIGSMPFLRWCLQHISILKQGRGRFNMSIVIDNKEPILVQRSPVFLYTPFQGHEKRFKEQWG